MTREWQPGDVAMVTSRWVGTEVHTEQYAVRRPGIWISRVGVRIADYEVSNARPLVVIDPEDMGAVERLQDCYIAAERKGLSGLSMQAALREFANPTPPKPDEPSGLGAVVRDADGDLWVRRSDVHFICPKNPNEALTWAEVEAVEVLSEGWSE